MLFVDLGCYKLVFMFVMQGGSLGPFSPDISRLLQLCDEEDDATSGLAAPKPDPDGLKPVENTAFHEVGICYRRLLT